MSTPSTPSTPGTSGGASGHNGVGHAAGVRELREQIAEERRDLTETISALHAKADVKAVAREKAREKVTDAEIAVADLASRAGRAAGSVVRSGRWAATTAADRVKNAVPEPVRTQAERAGGLLRTPLRLAIAGSAAVVAGVAALWWRGSRDQRHTACRR